MKVSQLYAGMLLVPNPGYMWLEMPWRGSDGSITGYYLVVVVEGNIPTDCKSLKREPVLYLGKSPQTIAPSTPGSQVVLCQGKKMTVDPHSWRHISLHV